MFHSIWMKKNKPTHDLAPSEPVAAKISLTDKQPASGTYHTSVLLHECLEGLRIKADGVYVDATFGGGGHSKEILKQLGETGRLLAFDQDADALQNSLGDPRFTLLEANFSQLKKFLRLHGVTKIDGLLADLGVSSYQFDTAERGFSFRFDGPQDMRMNTRAGRTAADIVNEESAETLQEIFSSYGEVRNSKTLANAIVEARAIADFSTTQDLLLLLEKQVIGERHKYFAQVFQALRIGVNQELQVLKDFLLQSETLLNEGGRLVVITFHSLEDRLVKNYMKHGNFTDEPTKDDFGNIERKWKLITKKPTEASAEEQKNNSRSRSAKLRIAERI